jgi:peptidoglycan/xylan/chitin deacetylase (PgdA/CDA1 family)
MPALRDQGIPAAFFLGGDWLGGGAWWSRLQRAFDNGCLPREVVAVLPPAAARDLDSASPDIHALGKAIRRLPPGDRDQVGKRLLSLVGPDVDTWLSEADIATLSGGGFRIGFHTRRHYALPTLEDAELEAELHDGRERLADISGQTIDTIAYPHGQADRRVKAAARRAGYRLGFTTEWAATTPASDPLGIGRLEPSDPSLGGLSLKIARALLVERQGPGADIG